MIFNKNIEALAKVNSFFRQVLLTGANVQVVVMNIPPRGESGEQVLEHDQVFVVVEGEGRAMIAGEETSIGADHLIFVPAKTSHNILNAGKTDMKLYAVCGPPQFKPGTIHTTKAEADAITIFPE